MGAGRGGIWPLRICACLRRFVHLLNPLVFSIRLQSKRSGQGDRAGVPPRAANLTDWRSYVYPTIHFREYGVTVDMSVMLMPSCNYHMLSTSRSFSSWGKRKVFSTIQRGEVQWHSFSKKHMNICDLFMKWVCPGLHLTIHGRCTMTELSIVIKRDDKKKDLWYELILLQTELRFHLFTYLNLMWQSQRT